MAFLDSFDDRATADIGAKYTNYSLVGGAQFTTAITSAAGRGGTNGLRLTRGASATTTSLDLGVTIASTSRYFICMARRWSKLPTSGNYRTIAAVRDAGTTQCELRLYGDGLIRLYRGSTLVTGAVSSISFSTDTYYHFEWDVTVHNTTGASELRVNGSTVAFAVTNQNTRNGAANQITEFNFRCIPSDTLNDTSWTDDMDDFIGHGGTVFAGDCRVGYLPVDGAGTYGDWTPNGAGTLYECVDDAAQDGDTTYASSATIGHKMTFSFANVPVTATIKYVNHVGVAKKTDAGTRTIAPRVKSGGSEQVGSNISPGTTYTYYSAAIDTDPATGVAWTPSGLNAAEVGDDVTA